jgi:type III secretory pathway component EscV
MPTATVTDVRGVIDTSLDDSAITSFLDDAEFEAEQAIDDYDTVLSTTEQSQLEKYLAALFIRRYKEKGLTSQSGESRSLSYENVMSVSELRVAVDKRDPSGTLADAVVRDTDRYSGSTYRDES